MLQKNLTKRKHRSIFFLTLPLILFAFIMQQETSVFKLSFSPVNVQSSASVDDDAFVFDTIGQFITIQHLRPSTVVRMRVYISGFFLVNDQRVDPMAIFTDGTSSPYGSIAEMNFIGWYSLTSRVDKNGELSLTMGNFAIINDEQFAYGFYLSDLIVYKRGL
jgi:hypothetical protein